MPQSQTEPCDLMYHLPVHQLFFSSHVGVLCMILAKKPVFGKSRAEAGGKYCSLPISVSDGLQVPIDQGNCNRHIYLLKFQLSDNWV